MVAWGATTTSLNTSFTGPTVSGSDTIGLVACHFASTGTVTSITWGGSPMTRVTPSASRQLHIFKIDNPSSGATISITDTPGNAQNVYSATYLTGATDVVQNADGTSSGGTEATATLSGSSSSGAALLLFASYYGGDAQLADLQSWEVNGSTTGVTEAYDTGEGASGVDIKAGLAYDVDGATGSTDSMSVTPDSGDDSIRATILEISTAGGTVSLSGAGANTSDGRGTLSVPTSVGYMSLDGAGDYISTPDKAALDLTGDIDLQALVAPGEWPPTTNRTLISKYDVTGDQRSYNWFLLVTTGVMRFQQSSDGATQVGRDSDSAPAVTVGVPRFLRVTRNGTTGDVTFYESGDTPDTPFASVSWSQIGAVKGGPTDAIHSGSADVLLGANSGGSSSPYLGDYYAASISGASEVADPDFRTGTQGWASPPGTDSYSNVWTLNGDTTWTPPSGDVALSGSGANASAGTGALGGVTVQLAGSGPNSSAGTGSLPVTPTAGGGLSAFGLAFMRGGRAQHHTRHTYGPGFIQPLTFTATPIVRLLTSAGPNAAAGSGDLRITGITSLSGAGANTSTGYGILGGAEPPTEPATVEEVIRSADLEVAFTLELLDADLELVEDLSADLESGTVTHGNFRHIHSTFSAVIGRLLSWESARLRPSISLTDRLTDTTFTWQLGVYLPETVERLNAEESEVHTVECYDLTYLLDTPYGAAFTVTETDDYLTVVDTLLTAAGIPSFTIDQTKAGVLVSSPKSWEIADENTYLKIINELLTEISYRPVYMDRDGTLRCEPYVPPSETGDVFMYDAELATTIIEQGATDELDLWKVPNRWVFINDQPAVLESGQPKLPVEGDGVYTVVNQSDGATSIDARGRVVSRIWRLRADSQASLVEQGDRVVDETGHTYHYVNMTTGPNPLHWHWDVFTLNHPALGAVGRYQSIEWKLALDKGQMSHRVRSL